MKTMKLAVLGAMTAVGMSLIGGAIDTADAASLSRLRLRCTATGQGDTSMAVKFEFRNNADPSRIRQKMTVEVEARVNGGSGIIAGDQLAVTVGGFTVAINTVFATNTGNVVADLNLDSRANGDGEFVFPAGFPTVASGTVVEAAVASRNFVMQCTL